MRWFLKLDFSWQVVIVIVLQGVVMSAGLIWGRK